MGGTGTPEAVYVFFHLGQIHFCPIISSETYTHLIPEVVADAY
jgi:hypothetical protein